MLNHLVLGPRLCLGPHCPAGSAGLFLRPRMAVQGPGSWRGRLTRRSLEDRAAPRRSLGARRITRTGHGLRTSWGRASKTGPRPGRAWARGVARSMGSILVLGPRLRLGPHCPAGSAGFLLRPRPPAHWDRVH